MEGAVRVDQVGPGVATVRQKVEEAREVQERDAETAVTIVSRDDAGNGRCLAKAAGRWLCGGVAVLEWVAARAVLEGQKKRDEREREGEVSLVNGGEKGSVCQEESKW